MAQPLRSFNIRGPGRFGLNVSQAVGTDDPRWALELTNAVFDDAGRVAARKGVTLLTTSGHEDATESVHEYIKDKDTTEIISAANLAIYSGTTTLTAVTGTITVPTASKWKFVNFNGKCIGVQQGHAPIVYSGTTFANITGTGSPPNGNDALSAWGRCWIIDEDKQGVSYCALLDETTWSGTGTGNIGLENYWPDGVDLAVALAQWQDRLLVFGERSILIYSGLEDPTKLFLQDIIDSGAVGRDAVVAVGNDLIYLSREGLRSVNRAIQYESLPSSIITTNVRDALVGDIASSTDYRMCYSETEGGVLAKIGIQYWYFDIKLPTETGDVRASQWENIGWLSCHAATDGTIYFGLEASSGGIGQYDGYADYRGSTGTSSSYLLRYRGTWLDNNGINLIPKRARVAVVTQTEQNCTFLWGYDFIESFSQETKSTGMTVMASEWNIAEWSGGGGGDDEWSGGGVLVRQLSFNPTKDGDRVQAGVTVDVQGAIAIEQIDMYYKLGRVAA